MTSETARVKALPAINLRLAATAAAGALLLALNCYLLLLTDWTMLRGGAGADWTIFGEAGRRILAGADLYAVEESYAFRYSPLLAYAFAGIDWLDPLAWRFLHVAAAASLFLLDRRLALLTLVSWPFWFDVESGNIVTFVFVLAAWSLAGHCWATGAFFIGLLLVPRPLLLPIAAWLLWKRPAWRIPFIGAAVLHAAAVGLTGWGGEWVAALVGSAAEAGSALNFGPSRVLGLWWVPIGLGLAAILTWRGRVGLAGLMASPYWLPYYFLIPLLDVGRRAAATEHHET